MCALQVAIDGSPGKPEAISASLGSPGFVAFLLGQLQKVCGKPESLKHRCAHSAFFANMWWPKLHLFISKQFADRADTCLPCLAGSPAWQSGTCCLRTQRATPSLPGKHRAVACRL